MTFPEQFPWIVSASVQADHAKCRCTREFLLHRQRTHDVDLGCYSWTASTPCQKCLEPLGRPGSEIRGFIVKGCRAPPCKVEVVVARRPETPTDAEACEVRDHGVDTRQSPRRRNARPSTCARTCDRDVTRGPVMVREDADGTSTRPEERAVDGAHTRNKDRDAAYAEVAKICQT